MRSLVAWWLAWLSGRPHGDGAGECPLCEYVGWAPSAELSEAVRRALRQRPPGGGASTPPTDPA